MLAIYQTRRFLNPASQNINLPCCQNLKPCC